MQNTQSYRTRGRCNDRSAGRRTRQNSVAESPALRLYSRPGCHLCEQSRALLSRLAPAYGFHVEEIDITTDHDAYLRYWASIPVVEVGDSIVPAALDEHRLRSVLDWELRDRTDSSD